MAASQNRGLPSPAEASVWIWDHDRRRIVWANDAALRFWGEGSLLDLIERDFAPADPATVQFAKLLHAAVASDGPGVRAKLVLTPLGRPQRVEAHATRFALSDGRTGLRIEAMPAPTGEAQGSDRMREIFETAPQATALFAEDGSLLVQNAAADFIFGTEGLSGLAQRYGARKPARDALRAMLISGSFSHTTMLNTRVGPRRHRVTMRRMLDPVTGSLAALTVFADTGEREEAQRLSVALEGDAEAALLSSVQAGVAVYDDALKPLYLSDMAKRLLGVPVDATTPQLGRLFPRDRRRIGEALLAIRDGQSDMATLELAVQGQDGAARWVQLQIRKGGWRGAGAWIATITDVTDGRRAAIAGQRATDDRDAAMSAIGVGVAALDADGRIVETSETARALLGGDPEGMRLADAFDEAGADIFSRVFEEENRNDAFTVARASDGQRLLIGISPKDRLNRNYRIVTLREETGRSAKPGIFESKEAVARASHELRTPLNAIMGFTQLMLDDPSPILSEAYVGYLKDINESGTYMLRLLQDLLDLRRIEGEALTLDPGPIDLANLARVIVREVEFAAKKREVDLTLSLEPSLPAVLADLHTMRQALTNIIGNAVKFTSPGGWVRISALRRASGAVELEVIDNGDGMTAEEMTVALTPFGQMTGSHQDFGGAGMGLPLAKGFIEANRARFEMTSEKGLGTIARLVFPPNRVVEDDLHQ